MDSRVIFFYPDYSGGNPYQTLLYHSAKQVGFEVVSGTIDAALTSGRHLSRTIFHLHWLNALFEGCHVDDCAWQKVDGLITSVNQLQYAGGKLIWTIHNHLPHENAFPAQDLRLRYFLAACADRIHLHCASHLDELSYLPINLGKVSIQRHGSYRGYYGHFSIKDRLDKFDPSKPRALYIGMLRGYKAIDKLLGLVEGLTSQGVQVVVAGKPESDTLATYIRSRLDSLGAQHFLRRLSEAEVHELCSNSDIGLLSYNRILTSGTLKLYLSYAMQIIAPRLPTIIAEDRYKTITYYDQNVSEGTFVLERRSLTDYKDVFLKSFLLADESQWSPALFFNL
jgi:hypothetical protein